MLNQKPCILVADDEPNICRIVKLIISPEEFDILTAENGTDAYEKTIKFQPNLVFSDILMPKCDGFELCNKIKSNPQTKHIPFVFLTGLDKTQFMSRIEEVNADDYLVKPFSSNDMKEKINTWIKKPLLNSGVECTTVEKPSINTDEVPQFQFGIPNIDRQFNGPIMAESFILLSGPIGSGKTNITRSFILDGIQREQSSLLISFEPFNHQRDPLFRLNDNQARLLHLCDASRWSSMDSEPWRNIDYIFDTLYHHCEAQPFNRIVFDSFSIGFAFWPIKPLLQFFDLCRTLPNASKQCLLWSINSHPHIQDIVYHLNHVVDIGIELSQTNEGIIPHLRFSKWQSVRNSTTVSQR